MIADFICKVENISEYPEILLNPEFGSGSDILQFWIQSILYLILNTACNLALTK